MTTIERVRAVIDAATPGPWRMEVYDTDERLIGSTPDLPCGREDAYAIALAHNLMPELLALWEAAGAVADFDWSMWERGDIGTVVMRKSDVALFLALLDRQRAALAALDAKAEEVES